MTHEGMRTVAEIGELIDAAHAQVPALRDKAQAWRDLRGLMDGQTGTLDAYASEVAASWQSRAADSYRGDTDRVRIQISQLYAVADQNARAVDRAADEVVRAKAAVDEIRDGQKSVLAGYDEDPQSMKGWDPSEPGVPTRQSILDYHDQLAQAELARSDVEIRQAHADHLTEPTEYLGLTSEQVMEPKRPLGDGSAGPDLRKGGGPSVVTTTDPHRPAVPTDSGPQLQNSGAPAAPVSTTPGSTPVTIPHGGGASPIGTVPTVPGGPGPGGPIRPVSPAVPRPVSGSRPPTGTARPTPGLRPNLGTRPAGAGGGRGGVPTTRPASGTGGRSTGGPRSVVPGNRAGTTDRSGTGRTGAGRTGSGTGRTGNAAGRGTAPGRSGGTAGRTSAGRAAPNGVRPQSSSGSGRSGTAARNGTNPAGGGRGAGRGTGRDRSGRPGRHGENTTELAEALEKTRPATVRGVVTGARSADAAPSSATPRSARPGVSRLSRPRPADEFRRGARAGKAPKATQRGSIVARVADQDREWTHARPTPSTELPPGGVIRGARRTEGAETDRPRRFGKRREEPVPDETSTEKPALLDGLDLTGGRGVIRGARSRDSID